MTDIISIIFDTGCSNTIFPSRYAKYLDSYELSTSTISMGDDFEIKSKGFGYYGSLAVIISDFIARPLLAVNFLTKDLNYKIFLFNSVAYICNLITDRNKHQYLKIVSTATLNTIDNLYHMDSMEIFRKKDPLETPINKVSVMPDILNTVFSISALNVKKKTENNITFTPKEIKYGNTRGTLKSLNRDLNKLEVLHRKNNHASKEVLLSMIKLQACLGCGVSYDEVKDLEIGACDVCIHSTMKAFPILKSISKKHYGIFEYISGDYKPFKMISIRGYIGVILYVDRATAKLFVYLVKSKSEWLSTFKRLIKEYGNSRNPLSVQLRFLQTDYCTEVHSKLFTDYLSDNNIVLHNSTPYKHEQNLIERHMQIWMNLVRKALLSNHAPVSYICYASTYAVDTHNDLPRFGKQTSRNEDFYGQKSDISKFVPFYASGWFHVTQEERDQLGKYNPTRVLKDKARNCVMLGYTNPYILPNITQAQIYVKDAYICYVPSDNAEYVRHDCFFKSYSDIEDPLNYEVNQSIPHGNIDTDYNNLFDDSFNSNNEEENIEIENELTSEPMDIEKEIPTTSPEIISDIVTEEINVDTVDTLEVPDLPVEPPQAEPKVKDWKDKLPQSIKTVLDSGKIYQTRSKLPLKLVKMTLRNKLNKNNKKNTSAFNILLVDKNDIIMNKYLMTQAIKREIDYLAKDTSDRSIAPSTIIKGIQGANGPEWELAFRTEMSRL